MLEDNKKDYSGYTSPNPIPFFVHVEGSSQNPTRRFNTLQEAEASAERLARKEGRRAYVLAPLKYVELEPTPFVWTDVKPVVEIGSE